MEIFDTLYEYILENYTLVGSKLLGDILHYAIEDTEGDIVIDYRLKLEVSL